MATSKEYAYFLKGNKIAIVQKDFNLSDGLNYTYSDPPGGLGIGTGGGNWKSPKEDVTKGIEIEYAYSPTYMIGQSAYQGDYWGHQNANGWTVKNGYLTFLRANNTDDLPSTPGWQMAGTAGTTESDASDYILIRNSSRWNGVHRVQEENDADATLQTWTKVNNINLNYIEDKDIDWVAATGGNDGYIIDGGLSHLYGNSWNSTGYIFIGCSHGSSDQKNVGLFSVSSTSGTSYTSKIYLDTRYFHYDSVAAAGGEDEAVDTIGEQSESADLQSQDGLGSTSVVYECYRDFCDVYVDIDVMNDEADEVPVSDYQAKALVSYVKAQMAEDEGDPEKKEYFMKEFRKKIEKQESARIYGPRIVSPGFNAIR